MKKFLLVTTLCLTTSVNFMYGQKNTIYLHAAPSFPIGDYGSTSNNSSSGFATTGFMSELGYSYDFSNHWGAELKLVRNSNGEDESAIAQLLAAELGSNYSYTVKYDPWTMSAFLVGAHYIFPFEKSNFKIQLLIGALSKSERSEAISVYDNSTGASDVINGSSGSASGFAACFGLQYQLNLSPSIGVDFMYESVASSLTYNTTAVDAATGSSSSSSHDQKIQFLSLGAGIHFAF